MGIRSLTVSDLLLVVPDGSVMPNGVMKVVAGIWYRCMQSSD